MNDNILRTSYNGLTLGIVLALVVEVALWVSTVMSGISVFLELIIIGMIVTALLVLRLHRIARGVLITAVVFDLLKLLIIAAYRIQGGFLYR